MNNPIGYIAPITKPIPGYIPCDGRRLWRTDYPELFAVLGTVYGGDKTPAMFNIPNLTGRVANAKSNVIAIDAKAVCHISDSLSFPANYYIKVEN